MTAHAPTAYSHPGHSDPSSASAAERAAARARAWVMTAAIVATGIAYIDGTAVNVALPTMQAVFHADLASIEWVIGAYILLVSSFMLLAGALGDRYGRKTVLGIGAIVFLAGSAACGLSQSLTMLIAARAVQGAGGAMLVPGSLALITAAYPSREHGRVIGLWAGVTTAMAAGGPVVGSWLTQNLSWRWIFYANLPLGVVLLLIIRRFVAESKSPHPRPIDIAGAVLAILALAGFSFALIEAGHLPLMSPTIIGAALVAAVTGPAFLWVESRARYPLLPLRLVKSPGVGVSLAISFVLYMALCGVMFLVPFDLQQVQGYSISQAGATFLPFIVVVFLLSNAVGKGADRFGARPFVVVGSALTAVAYLLVARPVPGSSYWTGYFLAAIVLGLGMAFCMSPLTMLVMDGAGKEHNGVMSGLNNTVVQSTGLAAVSAFGLVMSQLFRNSLVRRMGEAGFSPALREALLARSGKVMMALPSSGELTGIDHTRAREAVEGAFVDGFKGVMFLTALLVAVCVPLGWLGLRGNQRRNPHPIGGERDLGIDS